ncbi:MAG: integrase [Gallionellaceae bacterium]|nr:MAG: integrase [Gallionellaceae bacterium]
MSTMIVEVYEAFKDAGASEEKASKAAQAMADYDSRFARMEGSIESLRWMVGIGIALNMAILGLIVNTIIRS